MSYKQKKKCGQNGISIIVIIIGINLHYDEQFTSLGRWIVYGCDKNCQFLDYFFKIFLKDIIQYIIITWK